jgi:putative DNA primase/helicase
MLLPNHLIDLRGSGLSDSTIAAAGIYSETDHRTIAAALNRKAWPRAYGPALMFPFRDESGAVVLVRAKPDNPPKKNGKAHKYLQPSGAPIRAYIPTSLNGALADADRVLLLTEGEKKSLAAVQAGFATVGLVGVEGWHTAKSSSLIPDLERIAWNGRRTYIAFDSDAATNENVKTAEALLAATLQARGAKVKIVRFPCGPNGEKVGLDDYLVANGAPELWKLLETAEDPTPVDAGEIKVAATSLDPAEEAGQFLEKIKVDGLCKLRYHRGSFHTWTAGAYRERDPQEVRNELVRCLNPRCTHLTTGTVANFLDQLRAQSELNWATEPPAWLGKPPADWQPRDLLAARNGIFHLPSIVEGKAPYHLPATPKLFVTSAVDYDVALDARKPERWLQFLVELWPGDPESVACLQEWFGLLLTADTSQQKILCLISPRRGGKGTIARVIRALIGPANVCGPTLAGLAGPFGLSPLVGRSVAIIPDARLSSRSDKATVTERLLAISGEDLLTIDRKYLTAIHTKLPTRLILLSNEIPRLADASGTVASRMICLRMTRSWFGAEDHGLTEKLLAELPGILLWSIGGWARLRQRGHFVQPSSGAGIVDEMENLASPVGAFVRDRCNVGPDYEVAKHDLFEGYVEWCKEQGKVSVADAAIFGRDLRSVLPGLEMQRPRIDGERVRAYVGVGLKTGF